MNYEKKISILKNLQTLKSFGYEYCDDISLNINDISRVQLPSNINSLKTIVENCNLCQCSKTRSNILFGEGDIDSKIFFIGDFNSTFDDQEGKFYQGNVGVLLANMIENVLLIPKNRVYLTNVLKCLPSNDISINDINICKEYLLKQLQILKPKIIVTLGEDSFLHITNNKFDWNKVKGNIIKHNNYTILPMFHPSYILRNPTSKKEAYQDMLKLKLFISENKID
jgi:DNA polymerase